MADIPFADVGAFPVVHGRGLSGPALRAELYDVFARSPRGVVCDLRGSEVEGGALAGVFGSVLGYLFAWPGAVLIAVSGDQRVRDRLLAVADCPRLLVTSDALLGTGRAHELLPRQRDVEVVLNPERHSPRLARRFATETLEAWMLPDLAEPICLVVSELVTNAVLHAETELELSLSTVDSRVLVQVRDQDDTLPAPGRASARYGHSGRGLLLVHAFARGWGVFPSRTAGKRSGPSSMITAERPSRNSCRLSGH